jgi:outer membrane immunogenic protein
MKAILIGGAALSLLSVSAFAADIGVPRLSPLSPPPPSFSWTSCYGGLHVGGGIGQEDLTDTAGALFPTTGFTTANRDTSGYMLGGQIGCDYQFASNWVVGLEGAASGGDIGGSTSFAVPLVGLGDTATFKETTDFLASVTGRVGYVWDRWMLYGKGGVAEVNSKYSTFDSFMTYDLEGLENRIGWTAGAGVEWALWQDWSVRLEYDYYGLGSRNVTFIDSTISFATGPEQIKQNIQTLMLGVNFHAFADQ